jgi:hypothetical protein
VYINNIPISPVLIQEKAIIIILHEAVKAELEEEEAVKVKPFGAS